MPASRPPSWPLPARDGSTRFAQPRTGSTLTTPSRTAPPSPTGLTPGVAKVCVYVDGEEALLDLAARGRQEGFAVALIRDAGMTEFHGKATFTCLAFEPLPAEKIDPLTGDLPLY